MPPPMRQALVDHRLRTARIHHRLMCTPLGFLPESGLSLLDLGGGCWRAGNPDHLAHLHQWTLPLVVPGLPAPPTLLPWCLRASLWAGKGAGVVWGRRIGEAGLRVSTAEPTRPEPRSRGGSHLRPLRHVLKYL